MSVSAAETCDASQIKTVKLASSDFFEGRVNLRSFKYVYRPGLNGLTIQRQRYKVSELESSIERKAE